MAKSITFSFWGERLIGASVMLYSPWCIPTPTSLRLTRRDLIGVIGTGLGVLNSIDAEVLINKLSTATSNLNKLENPLHFFSVHFEN